MEYEIGIGKTGRRAYGLDEVAIVPSRRTRDPDDVDISWEIDAYTFPLPMMASAMDAGVSPATAIEVGRLGGLACLNLEGLQTRYEDPEPVFDEIASLPDEKATRRMQELYKEPVKPELIVKRIREIKDAGHVTSASITPQRVIEYAPLVLEAELDILVIQGTVVSAEHVSTRTEPLNLKEFIATFDLPVIVGGCASYSTALHLMRTGAVGRAGRRRPRECLHDARRDRRRRAAGHGDRGRGCGPAGASARDRSLLPRDRGRRHADRRRHRQGDRLRRRRGDDRLAVDPCVRGARAAATTGGWRRSIRPFRAARASRRNRSRRSRRSWSGPAHENDGTFNLFGALATSMATTGYANVKEFQKAELVIAPAIKTEGKLYQTQQRVGMGH